MTVAIPTYPDLQGKVAVVTGGSKGIGAATSVLLGHNGARVAVCGRDPETIQRVTSETRDAGAADAVGLAADLTTPDGVARLRADVEDKLGPAGILFAFAGGFGARTPLLETELEEWNHVVESNLTSTFLTLREFAPGMVERNSGSIVTMGVERGALPRRGARASRRCHRSGRSARPWTRRSPRYSSLRTPPAG